MSQRTLPVALVGAGLPQLPGLMVDAKSYAERLFAYPRLGPLSEDAARQALVAPARARDVAWEEDSLIKKGLIYNPDYGQVDFTVPKFSPFMRRRYPLEAI